MNWHLLPITKVTQLLETSPLGIDVSIASKRLEKNGKNQIEDAKKKTVLQLLLHQLSDFMILILALVAVLSGIIGEITDTLIIIAILLINGIIGFIQEYRAEKAIQALRNMVPSHARVMRSGIVHEIQTKNLVPGDVVLLEAGNSIPADVRFFETHQIKVDESTLTGESQNVEKNKNKLSNGEYALGDRINMGFKGTFITNGRGKAYVTATGMHTELGKIAKMIQKDDLITPLQKKLAAFGKRLFLIILLICILIFIIGWINGEAPLHMLLISISLAVAALPEALPALITITLALGAKKLVKNNALIRKLPTVETLGSVTYICSDKTGTLTMNKMIVAEIYKTPNTELSSSFHENEMFYNAMALNNDVSKIDKGKWLGDSTEVALVQYALEQGIEKTELEIKFPRVAEIPFDASRKCMTTLHKTEKGILVITKGAVDVLLNKIEYSQKPYVQNFELKANEIANKGYRVLGFAIKEIKKIPIELNINEIESALTFIGIIGIIDPPRGEVKYAIQECKEAGIIPVMITGDHTITAVAIAKQLGIISSKEDIALSGNTLSLLSEKEFETIVQKVRVYARVNPEQKLKIIKALQANNQIIAMTGDGINDAPALKNADIGIAMGIMGTEVAKEAADMILLDDNYATIIVAVKHGRMIYDTILKFIKYILTGNFGEIATLFLAPFFGLPIPLFAIHILWINLVTDGLPGLALASEPPESNIMKRPPRRPSESVFSRGMVLHIVWVGFLMATITLGMQAWAIQSHSSHWRTIAFTVLCFSQLGHVMAIRSDKNSLFKIGFFSNKMLLIVLIFTVALQLALIYTPFLNQVFKTQPLTLYELVASILASSLVFWAVEINKWIIRRKKINPNNSEKKSFSKNSYYH